jgi:hypothetical protein
LFANKYACDQESTENEKNIYTEESAGRQRGKTIQENPQMEDHDKEDRDTSNGIERRVVFESPSREHGVG